MPLQRAYTHHIDEWMDANNVHLTSMPSRPAAMYNTTTLSVLHQCHSLGYKKNNATPASKPAMQKQ